MPIKTINKDRDIPVLMVYNKRFKAYLKHIAHSRNVTFRTLVMTTLQNSFPAWRDQMLMIEEQFSTDPNDTLEELSQEEVAEYTTPTKENKSAHYNPHATMYEKPEQAPGYSKEKGIRTHKGFYIKKPTQPTPTEIPKAYSEEIRDEEFNRLSAISKAKRDAEDAAILAQLEAARKQTPTKPHQNTRSKPKKSPAKPAKRTRANN